MKQLLRGLLALVVILGLTLAAIWLVRSAPPSSRVPFHQVTATSHSSQPTPGETSPPTSQSISANQITATVTLVAQPAPEPTATPTFEPTFDSLRVVSVEEITAPVGLSVDWSPDGQKALVAREITTQHILTGVPGGEHWTAVNLVDLWVWYQQTGQDVIVTDRAMSWDWSPNSDALVYVIAIGDSGFNGELRIFDLSTQTTETIVETDVVQAYPEPFWLSNGEIVYMDEARLWTVQPDGSNRHLLNDLQIYNNDAVDAGKTEYDYTPDKAAGRLYFSPDETRIAYITFPVAPYRESQLWITDLGGGNRTAIEDNTFFKTWASDGTFFLYGKAIGDGYFYDLWIANADGSNPRRLVDATEWGRSEEFYDSQREERPGDIGQVALSPNNKFIVFSELSKGGLWLLDVASGQWRVLSQDEMFQDLYQVKWLADDEIIVSIGNNLNVNQFQLALGE